MLIDTNGSLHTKTARVNSSQFEDDARVFRTTREHTNAFCENPHEVAHTHGVQSTLSARRGRARACRSGDARETSFARIAKPAADARLRDPLMPRTGRLLVAAARAHMVRARHMRTARAVGSALSVLVLGACAAGGPYTPVSAYEEPPAPATPTGYVIQPGDVLQVRVFNQPDMSARAKVRDDGKVSIPFLNDVVAAGFTPNALAQQLQQRLKEFINSPVVTVSLEEARPFSVSVLGEVNKPGVYAVPVGTGVLQALAAAGGFTQYASRDRIFVVRETPQRARIRFQFEELTQATGKAATFRLRAGDTVVVE
jgi:polysaccharide export outer membrane protein